MNLTYRRLAPITKKILIIFFVIIVLLPIATIHVSALTGDKSDLGRYHFFVKKSDIKSANDYSNPIPLSEVVCDEDGCPVTDKQNRPIVATTKMRPRSFVYFDHDDDYASQIDSFGHNPNDIKGGLARTAYIWATEIFGNDIIDKTESLLRISIDGGYKRFWLTIKNVYNAIAGIGIVVAAIYFLLALLEKIKHELANLESVVKLLMKLLIAILIINNGLPVLEGSFKFSNAMLDAITGINDKIIAEPIKPKDPPADGAIVAITDTGTGGDLDNMQTNVAQRIVDEYWVRALETTGDSGDSSNHLRIGLGMVIELIIPHLMISIITIFMQVLCYSRTIELFVRMAFAPIGITNIFQGGINSAGVRYLKKIIAVFLQGSGMLVIMFGYQALTNIITMLSTGGELTTSLIIFNQVLLGFAVITLMIKTHTWINDLMGV